MQPDFSNDGELKSKIVFHALDPNYLPDTENIENFAQIVQELLSIIFFLARYVYKDSTETSS